MRLFVELTDTSHKGAAINSDAMGTVCCMTPEPFSSGNYKESKWHRKHGPILLSCQIPRGSREHSYTSMRYSWLYYRSLTTVY